MLIKLKKTRSHLEDRKLALWLATSAGLLNAMALGAFGLFPSHMSGNASRISNEISALNLNDFLLLIAIIVSFAAGAFISRLLVIWGTAYNNRLIFCHILFMEGAALTGVSFFEIFFHSASSCQMIIVLCGLMGIHNATSTQLSNGRVRSTHITGALTDAGLSLASLFAAVVPRYDGRDFVVQRSQFVTHLITISSFLTGGIAGLALFKSLGFPSIAAVGVTLMGLALRSMLVVTRRTQTRIMGRLNGTTCVTQDFTKF